MFLIKNDAEKDKGFYVFNGENRLSNLISLLYSDKEIVQVLEQIKKYTQTPRDFRLILENELEERIYVEDNISLTEMEELRAQGFSEEQLKALNYFTILCEGEFPIS